MRGSWAPPVLCIDVVGSSGRAGVVSVRVLEAVVELRYGEHRGAFDRRELDGWLAQPDASSLQDGDVVLGVDWMVDTSGRVAISVGDITAWTLSDSDSDSDRLRSRVAVPS